MKHVYTAKLAADAYLIKGFLESAGIEAVVRGEYLVGGQGELPAGLCSVWITDDAQYAYADRLVADFLSGNAAREARHNAWRCPKCGEQLEGQFTQCWQCGAARPD